MILNFTLRNLRLKTYYKILIIVCSVTFTLALPVFSYAQAKKPTLMILPSDNWCVQRYFITEFDNQGTKQKVPNYKQAFQEDTEIGQVISKIGSLMIDRGFPLKDVEQEIKNLEQSSSEDAMASSTSTGSSVAESPLDKLKKRAKADIIIQIWWSVNKTTKGKSINFTLEAFDAYTSKRIAASTGTSSPSDKDVIPVLLMKAIESNMNLFTSQIQDHFDDMFKNGREIKIKIQRWQNWSNDLETEYNGIELSDVINEWLQKNSVKGMYNISDATENFMTIEQLHIPMYDAQGRASDARQYTRDLQKLLKAAPYNIDSKLMTRGLGEAIIVLGEK